MPKVTSKTTATKKVASKAKSSVVKTKTMPVAADACCANTCQHPYLPTELYSNDSTRNYGFSAGTWVASSFTGFVAGIIVAVAVMIVMVNVFFVG